MGSRRSSIGSELDQPSFLLEDGMSETQRQLAEINDRYSILGDKLAERKFDMEGALEKAEEYRSELQGLTSWMDKTEVNLRMQSPPALTTEEAKKQLQDHLLFVTDLEDHGEQVGKVRRLGDEVTINRSHQPGAEVILGQLTAVEEKWIRLQDKAKVRTQELETAINSLSDFEQAHNRLNTWLNEKAKMLSVLGPIGIEPDILKNQKLQVEVLQEEFVSHEPQLEHIQEAGQAILDKQEPTARSRSPILHQMNEIQEEWDDLKKQLDDRENQIDDVTQESEPFHESLQDLSDWMIDFNHRLSSLPPIAQNPDAVRQQKEETKALQKEADRKKAPIESMVDNHRKLEMLNPEQTAKAEVTLKLDSIQTPYQDLCRKLDERQGKLQAALLQSQDFEDSYDNMVHWVDGKDKELQMGKPISARPEVLRRQVSEHEEIPKEIIKQVYTYQRMLNKIDALIEAAPEGAEKNTLQDKRDRLNSKWEDLDKKVNDRKERLTDASDKAKDYTEELNQFLPWLKSAEDRLGSLGPVVMKPNVVKRQSDTLKQIQDDIVKHRENHAAVNENADKLLDATDVDHPYIKDQVKDLNNRWDRLGTDVEQNLETLDNLNDQLNSFQSGLNQSLDSIAVYEERLASQDSGRPSLDSIKELESQIEVLESNITFVKDGSSNLMATAPSQADTTQINDEIDGTVRRYEKLKNMVLEKRMQLEAGNKEVQNFQSTLNDISAALGDNEDILDSMEPVARDIPKLEAQSKEIIEFQDGLEAIKGEMLKAETVYREIIDKGFMSDPEGFREQLDGINKRWAKIRERANARHADVDRTIARMQDLKHSLDEVNSGLDKAEAQVAKQKPVGADVDTIKMQEKEFNAYMRNHIDPLAPRVREVNRLGQNLVQSAAPRVDTNILEGDLKDMNDRWNNLIEKNNERRGNLNEGLLRCGKFQEALQSLLSWISDTEEMVSHQRDPSSDYNVVKAQISEQQLFDRIITDREPSVTSLKDMGEQLAKVSDSRDRQRIQQQLSELERRWDSLKNAVGDRRDKLQQTAKSAKEFHDQVDPLLGWLDTTERRQASQGPVGTTRPVIQRQMKEQKVQRGARW